MENESCLRGLGMLDPAMPEAELALDFPVTLVTASL